jgi:hypothetical protein
MATYNVIVKEVWNRVITINAESEEEAKDKVREFKYDDDGELFEFHHIMDPENWNVELAENQEEDNDEGKCPEIWCPNCESFDVRVEMIQDPNINSNVYEGHVCRDCGHEF